MLVPTISFEIRNFKTGESENFCVLYSRDNLDMINSHRYTRDIHVENVFDFELPRKLNVPKFIQFGAAVAESLSHEDTSLDISDVDEMVGVY